MGASNPFTAVALPVVVGGRTTSAVRLPGVFVPCFFGSASSSAIALYGQRYAVEHSQFEPNFQRLVCLCVYCLAVEWCRSSQGGGQAFTTPPPLHLPYP